ncbi:MAG TPA: alpha/beta hydrolase [Blastocatellia bacterium]|nr:alpha/beta hydrolase [Blastocatellia bacterium]
MISKTLCAAALFIALPLIVSSPARAAKQKSSANDPAPRAIELWPKGAPAATGASDEDKPAIIPYLPASDKNTGAGVLICPGGAFTNRAVNHEGVLIAQWLKARGIAGFVLRYRIRPLYTQNDSTQDAQRGLRYLRARAAEFRLDPNRIGVIGFSAGAELATFAVFKPVPARPEAEDPIDRVSSQANFMILAYGSSPMPASLNANETPIPPTFMFCTAEDMGHLRGMMELYANLVRAKVPVETHFFVNGEHGVGLAEGDPVLGEWPNLMFNWMRAGGVLTPEPRIAVEGIVKVDGEPLPHGYVIFTPLDINGAPPVTAYVFNTGQVLGRFVIRQNQGLTPGRYRVEVRQNATRWLSNSRNEVIIKMNQKLRAGAVTEADRQEWNDYARKRDLSPNIEAQRVYRRRRPGDKSDLVVEVKGGVENSLQIEVFSR